MIICCSTLFEVCCFSLDGTPLLVSVELEPLPSKGNGSKLGGGEKKRIESRRILVPGDFVSFEFFTAFLIRREFISVPQKRNIRFLLEWKNFSSKEKSSHPRDIHRIHFASRRLENRKVATR